MYDLVVIAELRRSEIVNMHTRVSWQIKWNLGRILNWQPITEKRDIWVP